MAKLFILFIHSSSIYWQYFKHKNCLNLSIINFYFSQFKFIAPTRDCLMSCRVTHRIVSYRKWAWTYKSFQATCPLYLLKKATLNLYCSGMPINCLINQSSTWGRNNNVEHFQRLLDSYSQTYLMWEVFENCFSFLSENSPNGSWKEIQDLKNENYS